MRTAVYVIFRRHPGASEPFFLRLLVKAREDLTFLWRTDGNTAEDVYSAMAECRSAVVLVDPAFFGGVLPRDLVEELQCAYDLGLPILPVLLDHTQWPDAASLDPTLRPLLGYLSAPFSLARADYDMVPILRQLDYLGANSRIAELERDIDGLEDEISPAPPLESDEATAEAAFADDAARDAEYRRRLESPQSDVEATVEIYPGGSGSSGVAAHPLGGHEDSSHPPSAPGHWTATAQATADAEYRRRIGSAASAVSPTLGSAPAQREEIITAAPADYSGPPAFGAGAVNHALSDVEMLGTLAAIEARSFKPAATAPMPPVPPMSPMPPMPKRSAPVADIGAAPDRAPPPWRSPGSYFPPPVSAPPPRPMQSPAPPPRPVMDLQRAPAGRSRAGTGFAIIGALAAVALLLPLFNRTVREGLGQAMSSLLAALNIKLNVFSFFARLRRDPEPPPVIVDMVDCSVFAPPAAPPGATVMVQVFLHVPEHAGRARFQAAIMDETAVAKGVKSLETPIARGAAVMISLEASGADMVDEPVQTVVWRGEPVFAQFLMRLPQAGAEGVFPKVRISVAGGLVGCISFRMGVTREAAGTKSQPRGDQARRYTHAFLSYATADRKEVLKRAQVLKAAGVSFFQDILSLEPGQRWEREIFKNIDECDLFLLFWSKSARESGYVLKEAEYALARQTQTGGETPDIVPVILEGPPVVLPPPSLAALHFNDKIAYLVAQS